MAITTVNPRYEGFIFDGENSRDYGIYVQNVKVFGAPTRDVEMISIPGRDGEFVLDKGRFNNIQVVYTCALGTNSQTDFNTGVSDFRNWLASRKGYKRLEDEINIGEYRMAVFKDGLDVSTLNKETGTFEVTFDCKPQRFLKSGEIPRNIGGSVTNTQTKSGAVVSLDSDGGDAVTSLVATIEAVQAGSGDPSPTNVRAITGWTEAKVFDTGKNLIDESAAIGYNATVTVGGGYISVTKNASSNYPAAHIDAYLRAGVTYTVSATCVQATAQAKLAIRNIAPSNTTVAMMTGYFTDGQRKSVTYTPTKSGMYRVALFSSFGADDSSTAVFTGIQCEVGSTATAYEPYTGTTTTTALGRTVYGGEVDVVAGTLTVTHKAETFNGTEPWGSEQTSGGLTNYYLNLNNAGKMAGRQGGLLDDELLCNWLAPSSTITTYAVYVGSTSKFLNCKCSSASDVTAFKSILSATPLVVVYPLETPQTYNLTAQQVELLAGQNNVWADTGDITLTYGHDPDKIVNPTPFDARPLLKVDGYGRIVIGGELLSIYNLPLGDVALTYSTVNNLSSTASFKYVIESTNLMNIGDPFYLSTRRFVDSTSYQLPTDCDHIEATEIPQSSDSFDVTSWTWSATISTTQVLVPAIGYILKNLNFIYGTPNTTSLSWVFKFKGYRNGSNYFTSQVKSDISVEYNGNEEVAITISDSCVTPVTLKTSRLSTRENTNELVYAVSSVSANGTTYIDLDLGDAYINDSGSHISANNYVEIPAQLPVLETGANVITFDDTIEKLEIVPRWWEV